MGARLRWMLSSTTKKSTDRCPSGWVLVLALASERTVVGARVAGLDEVDLVAADDVPDVPAGTAGLGGAGGVRISGAGGQRAEQQLAVLAVRLEMAAVYLRLARG